MGRFGGERVRFLIAAVMLCGLTGCDLLTGVDTRLARAEQHLAAGDYGEAQVDLKNVIDKRPNDTRALLALGRLAVQTGDFSNAEIVLKRAEKAGADVAAVAEVEARLMLERAQYQPLLVSALAGTLPVPEPNLSLYRARALAGLGRTDEAIALFSSLLDKPAVAAQARVGLANAHYSKGDMARATREIDQAVAADPKSALALLAKGTLLQRSGHGAEAEAFWQKALDLARGQLTVQQHLGLLTTLADGRMARGDLEGVKALHASMVKVSPQGPLTVVMGARISVALGDAASAAQSLQRIVNLYPALSAARMALVSAQLLEGNLEQATTELVRLKELLPNNNQIKLALAAVRSAQALPREGKEAARRWIAIGSAELALDQPMAARQVLQKALQADPDSFAAASGLVTLDLRAGKSTEALAAAEALRAKHPQEPVAFTLTGDAYAALKQYGKADEAYGTAWSQRRDPSLAVAIYRTREAGKLGRALEPLAQWVAEKPDDVSVRSVYASALMQSGNAKGAMGQYEQLVIYSPRDIVAYNNLAILYAQAGDKRALATAQRAYEISPGVPAVADTLGWLLASEGKNEQALPLLDAAAADDGAGPEIKFHHAVVLARVGQSSRAKSVLRGLIDNGEKFTSREAAEKLLAEL